MPLGPTTQPPPPTGLPRPEPIRGRTLIALRWVAVAGQLAAVAGAYATGVRFPVLPVLGCIAAGALVNLYLRRRPRERISEGQAFAQLAFDIVQLGVLLMLTGGSLNPFALLMLAPVTVGATALRRAASLRLVALTLAMVTVMSLLELPLHFVEAPLLPPTRLLQIGNWLALIVGCGFFAFYAGRVSGELFATSDALFATQLALQREQRLQHLGGIVAAAAHEMGTPLATMKLVSAELADELATALPDRPDITEDLALLRASSDRCRDILRSMGQAGKDDLHLRNAPLAELLSEAAGPHEHRGRRVVIDAGNAATLDVRRDPGIIHALRNLIQNAVDFARSTVTITAEERDGRLFLTIQDDGPGYPAALLPRLGDPFLTTRRGGGDRAAAGYEGMGLGLFIARTLLERSGAEVRFANQNGAQARLSWPVRRVKTNARAALGQNPRLT